jgi:putative ABC transport system permease protein
MQADATPVLIPPEGLVLSEKLAEVLNASVGDHLELTPVRGRRRTVSVPVRSTIKSFLGLECYAHQGYLSRVVGEALAVNSVQLSVNPAQADALYGAIKQLPNAQGLNVPANTKANLEKTLAESMTASMGVTIIFAGVIAFGSLLSSSLIEIRDRTRDIATFRVLGYKPAQVAAIFFRENIIVFVGGLVVAFPIGYVLVTAVAKAYDTELFRMPVVWSVSTVATTATIAVIFVVIVQVFVYGQVRRIDWLEGIKIKE